MSQAFELLIENLGIVTRKKGVEKNPPHRGQEKRQQDVQRLLGLRRERSIRGKHVVHAFTRALPVLDQRPVRCLFGPQTEVDFPDGPIPAASIERPQGSDYRARRAIALPVPIVQSPEERECLLGQLIEHCDQKALFRWKVVMQRTSRDAGMLSNRGSGRACEPVLAQQGNRGFNQRCARQRCAVGLTAPFDFIDHSPSPKTRYQLIGM
ncbi:hypothetical protein PQQ66_17555 [Paraburkholderia sediminicola]